MIILARKREFLDRIGNVRDHLNRRPQIIAPTFLGDDVTIDTTRSDVIRLARGNSGEAFIVAKIEVSLGPVVCDVHFAMLIRAHRPRIDIQVGVELANADLIAASLQQSTEACCHETFSERGDHAAGDENIPRHGRQALSVELDSWQANCGAHWRAIHKSGCFYSVAPESGSSDAGASCAGASGSAAGESGSAGATDRSSVVLISSPPAVSTATAASVIDRATKAIASQRVERVRKSAAPRAPIRPPGLPPPIPKPPPSERCIRMTPTSAAATMAWTTVRKRNNDMIIPVKLFAAI